MATIAPSKNFFAVVHCISPWIQGCFEHALINTKIALENGADGVFLIGHNLRYLDIVCIYEKVRKQNPDAWIGVNFLDLTTSTTQKETLLAAIEQCAGLSGIWMNALPEEDLKIPPWIEIFAGVAFKYKNANATSEEMMGECTRASEYANFATTSGDKTGSPPRIEKLRAIYELLGGGTPLAVASGVDAVNVRDMLPYVTAFLVASSISLPDGARGGHEYLAPEKVRVLADIIHGYQAS